MWNWDHRYIEIAKSINATGLLIKAADGTNGWPQWGIGGTMTRAAGLQAIPWQYNYGNPAEIDIMTALDEPLVCLDIEAHFEAASAAQRQAFVEKMRTSGQRFWTTVEAQANLHGNIPYPALAALSEAMIPMVAWQVWQPRDSGYWLNQWGGNGYAGFPWLPVGDVTPDELAASVRQAIQQFGAASIWEAGILTTAQIEALKLV